MHVFPTLMAHCFSFAEEILSIKWELLVQDMTPPGSSSWPMTWSQKVAPLPKMGQFPSPYWDHLFALPLFLLFPVSFLHFLLGTLPYLITSTRVPIAKKSTQNREKNQKIMENTYNKIRYQETPGHRTHRGGSRQGQKSMVFRFFIP